MTDAKRALAHISLRRGPEFQCTSILVKDENTPNIALGIDDPGNEMWIGKQLNVLFFGVRTSGHPILRLDLETKWAALSLDGGSLLEVDYDDATQVMKELREKGYDKPRNRLQEHTNRYGVI